MVKKNNCNKYILANISFKLNICILAPRCRKYEYKKNYIRLPRYTNMRTFWNLAAQNHSDFKCSERPKQTSIIKMLFRYKMYKIYFGFLLLESDNIRASRCQIDIPAPHCVYMEVFIHLTAWNHLLSKFSKWAQQTWKAHLIAVTMLLPDTK